MQESCFSSLLQTVILCIFILSKYASMRRSNLTKCFLFGIVMLFSSSCAKKPVTKVVVPSAPIGNLLNNFLIATIDAYGKNMNHAPLHYRIVYDTNKNVDSIIWSVDPSYVSFYQFSYSGNKCTTRSDTLPGDNYDLIMGLNSNGTIQYIVNYDSSAMTYTGTELIGTHIYESSSYGITYDWFGGDIDDFDVDLPDFVPPTITTAIMADQQIMSINIIIMT